MIVGLVTARGGSKELPRKNVLPLSGKPLLAWTIEAARQASSVGRLLISTDDLEIAEVGREYGAEVPFMRPAKLAADDTPHTDVVLHALDALEAEGTISDYILVLQPTSPLRTARDIDQAVELARRRSANAVVSVTSARHHPAIFKNIDDAGSLSPILPPPDAGTRRQDAGHVVVPNGAIYLIRPEVLRETGTLLPEGAIGFPMPAERSIDIDTEWDFRVAEFAKSNNVGQQ